MNWMRRKVQPRLLRERLGEHRLARTGHVLDQQVALAQQRNQRQAHLAVLADDYPLYVRDDPLARLLDLRDCHASPRSTDKSPVPLIWAPGGGQRRQIVRPHLSIRFPML